MSIEAWVLGGLAFALFYAWQFTLSKLAVARADLRAEREARAAERQQHERAMLQANHQLRRVSIEAAQERERQEQLVSLVATMRLQGFSGGHMEQFEEPQTYSMDNEDEMAEYQRRVALVEEVAEEGDIELANGLMQSRTNNRDELEEYEEFEEF